MDLWQYVRFPLWALWQKRVLSFSPEQIRALQRRRLRSMLRHAARHSPFYQDRLRGLDLDRVPLDRLPTTNKVEIMDHFNEVVTDPRVRRDELERFMADPDNVSRLYLGRYAACHTSGSQGQPLIILQDRTSLEVLFALQLTRANLRRPGLLEPVRRLLDPGRVAVLAMRRGFYPSSAVWYHRPAAVRPFLRVLRLASTDPDLVEQLNAFRPEAIAAYPSTLELLALHRGRLRLAPRLRQVVSNSEVLTDQARERFRQAFGVPVLDNYSMGECNHLSNGCPTHGGVHVNADWAVLEVVDEHNRPVPPGEAGHKVLLTNLANRLQPFLRYEVGDRAVWATGPCGCGNPLPRLARIEGRTADFFWVRAAGTYRQMLSFVFKQALEPIRELREWQAIQEGRNHVRVRLELQPGTQVDVSRPLAELEGQLRSLGMPGAVRFDIEFVPRLGPDPGTGKFRRVISRVGPPNDLEEVMGAESEPAVARGEPTGRPPGGAV